MENNNILKDKIPNEERKREMKMIKRRRHRTTSKRRPKSRKKTRKKVGRLKWW